jgi:septum formation protein
MPEQIILASASTARRALLQTAGIEFAIEPAEIDETSVKREMRRRGKSAIACACILAEEKACTISRRHPTALVVGADQILVADSEWFDKPHDLAEARAHLCALRGRAHVLETGVCVARGGVMRWHAPSQPVLAMRQFSDTFLDAYIAVEGEALLGSVGAYRLEGRGVQLFSRITGDHFAVLGLPLIELLGFLREQGAIEA